MAMFTVRAALVAWPSLTVYVKLAAATLSLAGVKV
jgi:hypothetical protein